MPHSTSGPNNTANANSSPAQCYCGSGHNFLSCCKPYLQQRQFAPTPEALMRSRYSAFCSGNIEYLLTTHKSAHAAASMAEQLRQTVDTTTWLKLDVLHSSAQHDCGTVEFVAYYRDARGSGCLHEKSQFVREDGRWYYTTGQQLPPPKLGRNDPCWCGSGKKIKKCCGGKALN